MWGELIRFARLPQFDLAAFWVEDVRKAAVVVAIDLSDVETQPVFNPLAQIVYAASRHQVSDVWVAGKKLLHKRELTTLDLNELRQRAAIWQQRLA